MLVKDMRIDDIKAGKYVIAVSGGVDSMVLLELLAKQKQIELIVAHFDHSMRLNSDRDCNFVSDAAASYGFKFVTEKAKPGLLKNEASARAARYEFLEKTSKDNKCTAIVTAHHQDDVVETMLINLWRGTSWRGLTSLKSAPNRIRPLLDYSKKQLVEYAQDQNIDWREDPTNQDTNYLRNHFRHVVLPRLEKTDPEFRTSLLEIRDQLIKQESGIDSELANLNEWLGEDLNRSRFAQLPHAVAKEVAAQLLRHEPEHGKLSTKTVEKVVHFAKTAKAGKTYQVGGGLALTSGRNNLELKRLV